MLVLGVKLFLDFEKGSFKWELPEEIEEEQKAVLFYLFKTKMPEYGKKVQAPTAISALIMSEYKEVLHESLFSEKDFILAMMVIGHDGKIRSIIPV